jgi:hypothetical protein
MQDTDQNKEFIAEYDGHKFYALTANPLYVNKRFFYYISKSEQISTLTIPNDYFLAITDQLEVMDGKKFEEKKGSLIESMRFTINARSLNWYHTTIALIEAFVLVDDEPVGEIINKYNKIKRDTFIKNPEARFFFGNMAAKYLTNLPSDLGNMNLGDYLTKTLNIEPHLVENIMSHLASEPFGIITGEKPEE